MDLLVSFSVRQLILAGFFSCFFSNVFLRYFNPSNFALFKFSRFENVGIDLVSFELILSRMQMFIRLIARSGLSFICAGSSANQSSIIVNATKFISVTKFMLFFFQNFFLFEYPFPGMLTNWRTCFRQFFFSRKKKLSEASSPVHFFKNKTAFFKKIKKKRFCFPAIVLSLNPHQNLFLFSEAERLLLPILGPSSFFLDRLYWTYSFPVFRSLPKNIIFFLNFFAINYMRGRLSCLLMPS